MLVVLGAVWVVWCVVRVGCVEFECDTLQNKMEGRKMATVRDRSGQTYKAPVFLDGDDVRGKIKIEMLKGKSKVDHTGIRVELIGVIENLFDKN